MPGATIKVSKLSAAQRQLDCAIKLWFHDGDPVSIHTLAFASLEIVNAKNLKQGNRHATLIGWAESLVQPEYVPKLMQLVKQPMTFFKHADRDPHDILEFELDSNEFALLFATKGLGELGEQISDSQQAMLLWVVLTKPDLLKEDISILPKLGTEEIAQVKRLGKGQFFEAYLQLAARNRAARR